MIVLSSFFLCLFAFISSMLVIQNPNVNEETFLGLIILMLISFVMVHIAKNNWEKKNYSLLIPLIFLPAAAAIAGIILPLFIQYVMPRLS